MKKLCFSTNNQHKLKEIREILGAEFDLLSLSDIGCNEELPETHDTIEENSLEKAQYVNKKFNIDCFADDTGLEIDALNGAPGVYSARYAGEHCSFDDNMDKVLRRMEGKVNRNACFRTIITLLLDGNQYQFEGRIDGFITENKSGKDGFGYDAIFQPADWGVTFAEMGSVEKNSISHRGRAVKKLVEFLRKR